MSQMVQEYAKATLKYRPKFLEPVSVSDQDDGVVITHPRLQSMHCTNKRQVQAAFKSIRVAEAQAAVDAMVIAAIMAAGKSGADAKTIADMLTDGKLV